MDFLELAKKRQSCRAYDQKPVEPEMIAHCLTAARLAPSACNSQPWKFVVAIAAEHFCLAATELDLGTCIIGWFDEQALKRALAIPPRKRVELILTVGYPATDQTRPKKRKLLEDITCYNRYE